MNYKKLALLAGLLLGALLAGGCDASVSRTITNVSYDPTREFYEAYNARFIADWKRDTGEDIDVIQSHGGSGSQALAVSQGLDADVVTLALEADVQAVADAGLMDADWISEYAADSAPYTSAVVFLVRAGNPKNIRDWDDLIREDVGVVTPNPKTSGGARWNFLAAWAYADRCYAGDEDAVFVYIRALYQNVVVLNSGARGASTSFVENRQGDVLIAWENEAFLTSREYPGEYEIISPSISILCQPSVAMVDRVTAMHGTADIADAYLRGLYSADAQRLAASFFYRPSDPAILSEYAQRFDLSMECVTVADFGGWSAAQAKFFADNGVFDRIYE